MKKATLIKLLEKYPANREVVFKAGGNTYSDIRVEIENNYVAFETMYDEDKDVDVVLKEPKIEKSSFVRIELE